MNSPEEFQDIESNCSGRLSYVSSQPEMIPSSRALLSRDKRLPLDTWNQSGVQENVFGHQFSAFDSPRFPQRISSDDVQRDREAALGDPKAKTSLTSVDGHNYGAIPMLMFASRKLTTSSKHPVDTMPAIMTTNRGFLFRPPIPAQNNRDVAKDPWIPENGHNDFLVWIGLGIFFWCTNGDKHRRCVKPFHRDVLVPTAVFCVDPQWSTSTASCSTRSFCTGPCTPPSWTRSGTRRGWSAPSSKSITKIDGSCSSYSGWRCTTALQAVCALVQDTSARSLFVFMCRRSETNTYGLCKAADVQRSGPGPGRRAHEAV